MEKADAFHRECLRLWSSLDQNNQDLRVALNSAQKRAATQHSPDQALFDVDQAKSACDMVQNRLKTIKYHIPQPIGTYLKSIVGPISLSLPTREAKFNYKNSYENLKLMHSIFTICISILLIFFNSK